MTELLRVQQGHTYAGATDLRIMCCPACGVTYAIPAVLQLAAYNAGHRQILWHCPNGHELGYNGESEDEKARKKAEAAAEIARNRSGRLAAELEQTKASLRSQKAATTRAKRRHVAAVCPCCNRSFVQLRRHMEAKHPDFDPARP